MIRHGGRWIWIAIAALLLGSFPAGAAADHPVLALTVVPELGSGAAFEGQAYREDGSAFDTASYVVALYVQTGSSYWYKEYDGAPPADLVPDGGTGTAAALGTFRIAYDSGGESDRQAGRIHLLLLPAGSAPDSSNWSETLSAAVDHVTVVRTAEGHTTDPYREPRSAAPDRGKPLDLHASRDLLCLDVGLYTEEASGAPLTDQQIRERLSAVRAWTQAVRFYASGGMEARAYEIAQELGFRTVAATAYLTGDDAHDDAEIAMLLRHADEGRAQLCVVGNEALELGYDPARLVERIEYVRAHLSDDTIPVTTAETADALIDHAAVRDACDLLFPHAYSVLGGEPIELGARAFEAQIGKLRAMRPGVQMIVGETGWPTAPDGYRIHVDGRTADKTAVINEEDAALYFSQIHDWSVENDVPVFLFSAFDEDWKAAVSGGMPYDAHWGLLDTSLRLKDAYAATEFFQRALAGTWRVTASVSGGSGEARTVRARVTGSMPEGAVLVCAAYDAAGRLIEAQIGPTGTPNASFDASFEVDAASVELSLLGEGLVPLCAPVTVDL